MGSPRNRHHLGKIMLYVSGKREKYDIQKWCHRSFPYSPMRLAQRNTYYRGTDPRRILEGFAVLPMRVSVLQHPSRVRRERQRTFNIQHMALPTPGSSPAVVLRSCHMCKQQRRYPGCIHIGIEAKGVRTHSRSDIFY